MIKSPPPANGYSNLLSFLKLHRYSLLSRCRNYP
jgi:hypothetical protein